MSNSAFSEILNNNLKVDTDLSNFQDSIHHTEKVFLHFDKPYYSSGEMMWFKTYLVSAHTNRPDTKSEIVHVELIDPTNKIINSRIIKISQGGGAGEFYLPKKLSAGEYTIRAYTNFMRNFDDSYFFLKKIKIGIQQTVTSSETLAIKNTIKDKSKELVSSIKPDVQFFPEGGYMVNRKTSNIGFKAIDFNGNGIAISGVILDEKNEEILSFKTSKFGLGMFELTPEKNNSYRALITYNNTNYTYILPDALDTGVAMEVIDTKDKYQVILHSSLPKGVHRLTLTGLQHGKMVTVRELLGSYKSGIINVPKNFLQQGMVQFIISDKHQKPLCERLVFVETNEPKQTVQLTADKADYKKRELVTLNLELDSIAQTNMSLAVTDVSVVNADPYSLDIRSHLLLNSELKGEIEQPGYYFDTKNEDRKELLDLLMMTQGWRQFLWNYDDENKDNKGIKKYDHQTGIRFKGITKETSNTKKSVATEVSLTYMNKSGLVENSKKSFKNGQFEFGDFDFMDSTSVIIQAKNYKIKKRDRKKIITDYSIELDSFAPHPITMKKLNLGTVNSKELVSIDYIIRSKMAYENIVQPFDDDAEKLDEVALKDVVVKKNEKFENRQIIYGEPTHRVDMDDIQTFGTTSALIALQGKVPGLNIIHDGFNIKSIIYRGSIGLNGFNSPLILLNNMPTSLDVIAAIPAEDVSFVDIISSTSGAIYGSRALGGVISIYLKRGNEIAEEYKKERKRSGIINFTHPGYYKARKFYEPNYSVKKPEHTKFDYRTTIYWQPTIIADKNKKTEISFYAADIETRYRIDLQGISKDGVPIKKEIFVDVE